MKASRDRAVETTSAIAKGRDPAPGDFVRSGQLIREAIEFGFVREKPRLLPGLGQLLGHPGGPPRPGDPVVMLKQDWTTAAKILWEEAFAADPHRIEENTKAVLGDKCSKDGVFVWSQLTVRGLHALRRAVYPTVLEARA